MIIGARPEVGANSPILAKARANLQEEVSFCWGSQIGMRGHPRLRRRNRSDSETSSAPRRPTHTHAID
jgi:hypothetical protein